MLQEIHEQFANSPELSYSGIQSEKPIQCDLKKIVNECWVAWSSINIDDIRYYEKIWRIIFEGNGLRVTHWIGFDNIQYIPRLETYPMSFMYSDEYEYENDLVESTLSEYLNCSNIETEWKNILTNYLKWLGYVQK